MPKGGLGRRFQAFSASHSLGIGGTSSAFAHSAGIFSCTRLFKNFPVLTPGRRSARPPTFPAVPGGCPAAPPPAGACPRRAWLGGGGGAWDSRPGTRDAPGTLRGLEAQLPARACPEPGGPPLGPAPRRRDQQEVWRARRDTGSVATWLSRF